MHRQAKFISHKDQQSVYVPYPAFIKYFEGYTPKEIAVLLHLPLSTVTAHIHQSKQILRGYLHSYKQRLINRQ